MTSFFLLDNTKTRAPSYDYSVIPKNVFIIRFTKHFVYIALKNLRNSELD